jgi:hypothetical protein
MALQAADFVWRPAGQDRMYARADEGRKLVECLLRTQVVSYLLILDRELVEAVTKELLRYPRSGREVREQTETNPIGQWTERRAEGAADGRLRTLNRANNGLHSSPE